MKVTLTFEPDKPGERPTIIRVSDGKSSAPIELSGQPDEDGNPPSITLNTTTIKLSRDFGLSEGKSNGASGATIERANQGSQP